MWRFRSIALALFLGAAFFAVSQAAPLVPIAQDNQPGAETALRSSPPANPDAGKKEQEAKPLPHTLNVKQKGMAVRYPDGWREVPGQFTNAQELHNLPASDAKGGRAARIKITTEQRRDHPEAVRRLKEIEAEYDALVTYLNIGGWPAMQRRQLVDLPLPGKKAQGQGESVKLLRITTAIAADTLLIRLEGSIPAERANELADQTEAIGRSATFERAAPAQQSDKEIEQLRKSPSLRQELLKTSPPAVQQPSDESLKEQNALKAERNGQIPLKNITLTDDQSGASQRLGNGSEIEIAASANGQNIVVASNSGFSFSNNGGQTFTNNQTVAFPAGFNRINGDPSLAVGRSGTFYYALIGFPTATSNSTAMFVSTDNGQTFNFRANAVTCGGSGVPSMPGPGLCFADQEHIAADRFNAGVGGGDQVYSSWRNFDGTDQDPALVCSANNGMTWTAPIDAGTGAFPRIGVGQDGFVYVTYRSGGNIMLNKYSSCATGLAAQAGFPVTVAAVADVACPLPGVDRCNGRNVLSSQTVAVDDTNPNHVYIAYATNTVAPSAMTLGNENVIVRDSTDGGATWPAARNVTVNSGAGGPRFMPWVCAVGGTAYVSWYDRRPASLAGNDLTDFYSGSAFLDGGGNLLAGAEVKISGAADAQCASGWPSGVNNMNDSESCSIQPQLGGRCLNAMGMGSGNPCDFSAGGCPAGETCQNGRGAPKYGDYNGSACAAGRFYTAWASATTQPGSTAPAGIDTFFSSKIVCCVPQIQIPANPNFAATCVGTTSVATMNVCNTGKSDLEVTSIASSNLQFAVTNPSSGFPIVIGPDACFPFEVRFTPTSSGNKTTTLTVASNDPVNPSVARTVSAVGTQPTLATIVADSGNFGEVCVGKFKDLEITLNNSGGCDLIITSISSSSAQFQTAGVITFPLVIHSGDSLQIPFRFQPTSFGAKTAVITFNSNDPTGAKMVNLSGTAPSATIVVNDPIVFNKTCPGNTNNQTLTIGNSGGCDLIVTGIASSSAEFKVVGVVPFPIVIPPGSTRDITIQFMPMGFTVDPMRMAMLTIMSNDLATPNKMVKVIGIVPPPIIKVAPDLLDFGKVCLGKSKELPLTISNTGECNLTVSGISFSSTEFKLVSPPAFPFVIAPGGSRTVMASFMPVGMTGARMATMAINSDDPATPIKAVTLKGDAPVSAITVTGDFDWGDVLVGKYKVQVFNITNTEECDLAITLVCEVKNGVPQQPSIEFRVENILNYPVIIPAGKTLPVFIRFKPSKKGPREATLLVFGYDPQTSTLLLTKSYPLKGNGK